MRVALNQASRSALLALGLALAVACEGTDGVPDGEAGAAGATPVSGAAGALGGRAGNAGSGGSAGGGSPGGGSPGGSGQGGSATAGAAGTSGGGALGAGSSGASGAGATGGEATGGSGNAGAAGSGAGGSSGTPATGGAGGAGGAPETPAILVFSRTTGFRHGSIPAGIQALTTLAAEREWTLVSTEDASVFSDAGLEPYTVIVFLSTTGDILDAEQQAAFERFIRGGHGFVGIHSATDTEFDWPFYGELVGAYFREHPVIQAATVVVEDSTHPATAHLPETSIRTDEWYSFRDNPRPNVQVLLSLDESSYEPGSSAMAGDHPIAWYHEYEGGRAFQTALGHTDESYSEAAFLQHIAGGIEWASR